MTFLAIALVLGLIPIRPLHIAAAFVFAAAYLVYVWRTVADAQGWHGSRGGTARPVGQVIVGLGLIVGGAHLFVTEVEAIAHGLGVGALVLALVLAPLASELPEKASSFLWVREGKDTLALGNITGAMVSQSMLPVAVGMALTTWQFAAAPTIAAACALAGGALCMLAVYRGGRFTLPFIGAWGCCTSGRSCT